MVGGLRRGLRAIYRLLKFETVLMHLTMLLIVLFFLVACLFFVLQALVHGAEIRIPVASLSYLKLQEGREGWVHYLRRSVAV